MRAIEQDEAAALQGVDVNVVNGLASPSASRWPRRPARSWRRSPTR
jgi:hypothetical protein